MVPRSFVIGAEVVAVPPALEVRYMVRKKEKSEGYRMTTEEERCWRYLLQWPLATAEEVARETCIPVETVQAHIDRIGTPREVFEARGQERARHTGWRQPLQGHGDPAVAGDGSVAHGR
jgi:hypothetical protein